MEVAILEPAFYRDEGPPTKAVGDADRLEVYQEHLVTLAERMHRVEQAPKGDPEEVARAVVEAVEAKNLPLRTAVGAAARELLALRSQLTADEYEREMLERTGLG